MEKQLSTKEKAQFARKIYQKQWRDSNPEKVKGYLEKHYAKKYDEMMAKETN